MKQAIDSAYDRIYKFHSLQKFNNISYIDKLKNKQDREALKKLNNITEFQLNKNFFNTSIKEINTIILLKKFMVDLL